MGAPPPPPARPEEASLFTEVRSADSEACGARWAVRTHTPWQAVPGQWVPFGAESREEVAPYREFRLLADESTLE